MSSVIINVASGSKKTRSASRPDFIVPFLCLSPHKVAGPSDKYLLTDVRSKPRALAAVQNKDRPESNKIKTI